MTVPRSLLSTAVTAGRTARRLRKGQITSSTIETRTAISPALPAGLLTAIYAGGRRTDLLIVPPDASEQAAQAAMEQAGKAGHRSRTPALLAAMTGSARPAAETAAQNIEPGGPAVDHEVAGSASAQEGNYP